MKNKILSLLAVVSTIGCVHAQVNYSNTSLSGIAPSAIGINTKAHGNASFAAGFASETNAFYGWPF